MQLTHTHLTRGAIALLALALFAGGAANLAGVPQLHTSFAELGLPRWFGYFIGACEVAGAIGLLIRPLSALAAVGMALVMLGALYYHVVMRHPQQGAPALVILLLCLYVFVQRRALLPSLR